MLFLPVLSQTVTPSPPAMMRAGDSPRACVPICVEGWKKWSRSQAESSLDCSSMFYSLRKLPWRDPKVCRDPGQAEPKMGGFREPERSVLQYVSTGSVGSRHLQAGITWISTHLTPRPGRGISDR